MIELRNVCKAYKDGRGEQVILKETDLHIHTGERVAIVGRSGSGKSTLLNIIAGLTPMDDGEYFYNGEPATHCLEQLRERDMGIILQNYALLNDRTVRKNIRLPLEYRRVEKNIQDRLVQSVAADLGIADLLDESPSALSGGERQRTAIARALVKEPHLILADEPTGALDEENEHNVLNILLKLDKTLILVTHNMEIANLCDTIYYLKEGTLHC